MIVNLDKINNYFSLKNIPLFLLKVFRFFFHSSVIQKLHLDSKQLNQFFRMRYPRFKNSENEDFKCVSCGLCEEVCPTKAISIKKANLINFPSSLTTGEAPLHFYLKVDECIKCNLCAEICIVDALELKESYNEIKVDLVIQKKAEIADSGLE